MAKSSRKKSHNISGGYPSKSASLHLKKTVDRKSQSHEMSSSEDEVNTSELLTRTSTNSSSIGTELGYSKDHLLSSETELGSTKEHLLTSEDEKPSRKHKKRDGVSSSLSSEHSLNGTFSRKKEKLRKKLKKKDSISSGDQSGSEKEEKSSKKHQRKDSISSGGQSGSEKEDESSQKHKKKESISSSSGDQMSFASPKSTPLTEEIFKKPRNRDSVSSSSEDVVNSLNGFGKYRAPNASSDSDNMSANSITQSIVKAYLDKSLTQEEEEAVSNYSKLFGEGFLEKNNVWLLQCPKSVDCSKLVKQSLDLDKDCMLQIGDTKYDTFSHRSDSEKHVTLAVPSSQHRLQITRVPITGSIVLEEYVGVGDCSDFTVPDSPDLIEFPEYIRTRHPLLGLDYEKQPKTAERIEKKLKKKKKHSSLPSDFVDVAIKLESPDYDSAVESTSKKKRKRDSNIVPIKIEQPDYDSNVEHTPKKSKKRKRESDIMPIKIEQPDYDSNVEHTPKKSKKIKRESDIMPIKTEQPDYDSNVEHTPKKSKKRKRESDISTHESELSTSEESPKKKKKRKSEMPDRIEIKEEPVSEVKKKKKKYKSEES